MDSRKARVCAWFVLGVGCGDPQPEPTIDGDADIDADTDVDTDVDSDVDADVDSDVDSDLDCEAGINCVDVADPAIPICSDIGERCRDAGDCSLGFFCVADANGWPDGYCTVECDPDVRASCPGGSSCIYGGDDDAGIPHSYCFKDCAISDRNPWDTSSCGCRDGYQCDFLDHVCVPGCTVADAEDSCCPAELEGCTLTCNEDAYRCVSPGDPDADWGDPCEWDQDCPAEGRCFEGYCLRFGCDLDGRECGTNGGPSGTDDDCRNLGSSEDPAWLCVKTCNVTDTESADPFAPNVVCGADDACYPDVSDPTAPHNGFCWAPPRLNAVRVPNMGGPCAADDQCYSPYGQGFCLEEQGGQGWLGGLCGLGACDFPGMEGECPEPDFVCEPFGGGFAVCLDGCDEPGGGFGLDVGCRDDDYACYPSVAGAGVCMPNCLEQIDPDGFCEDFFGPGARCDAVFGFCG